MVDASAAERDLAAYYDEEAAERANRALEPRRIEARDEFVAMVPDATTLLEVGIGPGRDAAAFVAHGHTVVGVDLSSVFAAYATAAGANACVATARALPLADASFDAVWSMSTLMHIPDPAIDDALSEIGWVLRPGGTAVIGVWGGRDDVTYLPGTYGARLFCHRSDERWRGMLAAIGDVTSFDVWRVDGDPIGYQFAHIRRSTTRPTA
jgi:SAM-dependent methyltransferase